MAKAPDRIKTKVGDLGPEHFDGDPLDINPKERMSPEALAEFEKFVEGVVAPEKEPHQPTSERSRDRRSPQKS